MDQGQPHQERVEEAPCRTGGSSVAGFPGGSQPTTGRKAKKRKAKGAKKPPCKYGPRDEEGRCPKQPKKAKKGKKPCKYGPRVDGYCPKKPSSNPYAEEAEAEYMPKPAKKKAAKKAPARKVSTLEKAATKAAETAAQNALKRAAAAARKNPEWAAGAAGIAGTKVSQIGKLPKAAKVAALSGVALAGIAAFAATTYIITKRARDKEEREQQAFEAAQAYRQARLQAALQKGSALTPAENRALGAEFRAKLRELKIPVPGGI